MSKIVWLDNYRKARLVVNQGKDFVSPKTDIVEFTTALNTVFKRNKTTKRRNWNFSRDGDKTRKLELLD